MKRLLVLALVCLAIISCNKDIEGCTDSSAVNYNSDANQDDGSCQYFEGGGIVTNPGAGVTFNGYTYTSIVLGNGQEWMAENLRTTTYANGDQTYYNLF